MSVGGEPGHLHPTVTQHSGYHYFFYDKHHGRGGPEAARWLPELTDDDEFGIFDQADLLDLSDEHGNLYGIRIGPEPRRDVLALGTLGQQISKFPVAHTDAPWHGFPLGPMKRASDLPQPPARRMPAQALKRMAASGFFTMAQCKRLMSGKNI